MSDKYDDGLGGVALTIYDAIVNNKAGDPDAIFAILREAFPPSPLIGADAPGENVAHRAKAFVSQALEHLSDADMLDAIDIDLRHAWRACEDAENEINALRAQLAEAKAKKYLVKRARPIPDATDTKSGDICDIDETPAQQLCPAPDATALREALEGLRLKHKVCEDSWYSCPMSEEGCVNPSDSGCTCGAENHNKRLDDILALLRSEPREEPS